MQRNSNQLVGFMLAELIMVVLILTVAGILVFPLFAQAFIKARNTPCLSNLHELSMGLRIYMHDNDFYYPVLDEQAALDAGDVWGEGFSGHWSNWDTPRTQYHREKSIGDLLQRYGCEWRAWVCPSDIGAKIGPSVGYRWSSYGYRTYLNVGFAPAYGNSPYKDHAFKDSDIQYPSSTYVMNELWPWHDDKRVDLAWMPAGRQRGWAPDAHLRLLFADGHVKSMAVDQCLSRSPNWYGQGYDYHWPRLEEYRDCN